MTAADGPTAADWAGVAEESLESAQLLAGGHKWRGAYSQAGLAVEQALKGRLMRQLGLNRWPSRAERRDFYTHDLAALARQAELQNVLESAVAAGEALGLAWMVAKDFAIERRYPDGKAFPVSLGRDMVMAAARLVLWLNGPIRSKR